MYESARQAKHDFLSKCIEELNDPAIDVDMKLHKLIAFGEMAAKHVAGTAGISGSVLYYMVMHLLMRILI